MSNKLELKLLLGMVDKVTSPLKKMREGSSALSGQLKETQDKIKALNQQAAQVTGYQKISRSLSITSQELKQAQQATQLLTSKMQTSQKAATEIAQRYALVKAKVDTLNKATGVTPDVLHRAKTELKQLSGEMKTSQSALNILTKEQQQAIAKCNQLKAAHSKLKTSHKQQHDALRTTGIDTRKLADHQRTLTGNLSLANKQLDEQKRKLQQVSEQQKKLSAASSNYQKARTLQGNMAGTGATVAATGSAALYAGAQVLMPGLDFTAAQSKVQALTRLDKNDPQLKALRQQARELGASTSFTANDVSQGQSFLAMAGFDAKSIKQAMPGMLDLAKANDTDLATTSDIASNILSGFGLAADQMDRLGDVLTATTTRANVNLTMLGETMKYVAPVARDLGVSVEEAAAMSGLLGNIGIQASQGGTVMRAMLSRLAGQTPEATKAIEYLGLKTKDSAGNLRAVPDILADVVKATKGLGNADRADILKTIFGAEAGAGVSELIKQQGDGAITAFTKVLHNAKGENARVAKTMADNAKGDIDTLKSAWEDVGIELFEGNDGAIRGLIKEITGVVNSIGNWMRANPELTATLFKAAAAIAMVAVAGGTLTLMLAGILGPLAMLKYSTAILGIKSVPLLTGALTTLGGAFTWIMGALKALSLALFTTPIGWLVLGITALITAGYLLITNWETVKTWLVNFWEGFKSLVAAGVDAIKGYFNGLPDPIKAALSTVWDAIKTVFAWSPLGLIVSNFDSIIAFFKSLPATFASLGEMTMDGLLQGITSKISAVKETVLGMTADLIDSTKSFFGINTQPEPVVDATKLKKQIAGTTLALGMTAMPIAAAPNAALPEAVTQLKYSALPLKANAADNAQPKVAPSTALSSGSALTPRQTSTPAPLHIDAGIHAPITIQTTANMNPQDIARLVAIELEKRDRAQQARLRSSLKDLN